MTSPLALPTVVCVTGTNTEVGKTVTTGALAAVLRARGLEVLVVKVAQTGVGPDDPGDAAEVERLVPGTHTVELLRLRDPLAPDTAARREGVAIPTVADHARRLIELARECDVLLVEGSGGLLVRLDSRGGTLADLGTALRYQGIGTGFVLVASAALGTLSITALTAEALAARSLPLLGVVIGDWPAEPGLAQTCNVDDLPVVAGAPLLGRIPMGAARLDAAAFTASAREWLPGL